MVFKYLGNIESLVSEVAEAKEAVDSKYLEVLGESHYSRLSELSDRLLVPGSFFDSREQWKSRLKYSLPEKTPNKVGMIVDMERASLQLEENGSLKDRKIRTSMVFYISEEGFEYSGSASFTDRPIASYIHEFNHFVTYALQKIPLYLTRMILLEKTKLPQQTRDALGELAERLKNQPYSEEILNKFILGFYAVSLNNFFEYSNKILDKQILESIGINVNLGWRGKKREYATITLPTNKALMLPVAGDPFMGLDDREVIQKNINWQDYFAPTMSMAYLDTFLESIRNIKVSKVSINELLSDSKQRRKKRKNKKRNH
ncbi:hypothetical protein KY317_03735 [Candidatus Woesearchaeota archaeon]|nr:hypothetical protein [Candidatus Woesearchaeota archaeon]